MTETRSSKQFCLPCRHQSHLQGCRLGPWTPQGTSPPWLDLKQSSKNCNTGR